MYLKRIVECCCIFSLFFFHCVCGHLVTVSDKFSHTRIPCSTPVSRSQKIPLYDNKSLRNNIFSVGSLVLRLFGGQPLSASFEEKLNNAFTDEYYSSYVSGKTKPHIYNKNSDFRQPFCRENVIGNHNSASTIQQITPESDKKPVYPINPIGIRSEFNFDDGSTVGIDQSWVRKRIENHFESLSAKDKQDPHRISISDHFHRSQTPDHVMDVMNRAFSSSTNSRTPSYPAAHRRAHAPGTQTARIMRKLDRSESANTGSSSPPQRISALHADRDEESVLLGHGNSEEDPTLRLPSLRVARTAPAAADRMFQSALSGRLRSAPVLTQYADFLGAIRKDYSSAERHYREALGIRFDYLPALCGLGELLLTTRSDPEELERICLLAVRHGSKHAPTLCLYGRWLETVMLKPVQAEEFYTKAILESKRMYAPALVALAGLYREKKDFSGAEALYMEAASISPDDPSALYHCAHMLFHSAERPEDAESLFRKGLEIDGGNVDLLCHYGLLLLDVKRDIYQVNLCEKVWSYMHFSSMDDKSFD
jgi:tetratricopeptide (TPR) repeat protein